jgi:hypothetical protein
MPLSRLRNSSGPSDMAAVDQTDAVTPTSGAGDNWRELSSPDASAADGESAVQDNDAQRASERLTTALTRAALVGGALKGGLNLFGLLAKAYKKGPRDASTRRAALDAARDTASFAAFLVAFSGVYVAVDEGLATKCGKHRSKGWRAAVAGLVAGPALLLARGLGEQALDRR